MLTNWCSAAAETLKENLCHTVQSTATGQFPPGEEEEGPNNSLQHGQEEISPQTSPVARPRATSHCLGLEEALALVWFHWIAYDDSKSRNEGNWETQTVNSLLAQLQPLQKWQELRLHKNCSLTSRLPSPLLPDDRTESPQEARRKPSPKWGSKGNTTSSSPAFEPTL